MTHQMRLLYYNTLEERNTRPVSRAVPAREVRPGMSQVTFTGERDVVAFTCTVILLSGVCAPRQLALSLLGRIFNSPIGSASRALVKDSG